MESDYTLYQNFPNPFATLRYDLPEDSFVIITIYNILGNIVNNLIKDNQNSEGKSVQWNANKQRQKVAAGVYLYSI